MPAAVEVICPGCQGSFLVPFGIAETLCPYCDEHIVWRRCLDTDEVFPVLTKWATWVHPDCTSEHLVDLTVHITQPAAPDAPPPAEPPIEPVGTPAAGPAPEHEHLPASAYTPPPPPPPTHLESPAPTLADALPGLDHPPTGEMLQSGMAPPPGGSDGYSAVQQYGAPTQPPALLLDHAEWLEERVAGQLLVVHDQVVIVAHGTAAPVPLAPVRDIVSYGITTGDDAGYDEPAKKKRFRRGARVEESSATLRLSLTAPYGHWTIVGRGESDVVRSNLAVLAPQASDVGQQPENASPAFFGWAAGPQQPPGDGGQAPWGQ